MAGAVPPVVASGIGPLLVEYIDMISMAGITANAGIDLGIPDEVRTAALAYLVIVLESHHPDRLEQDTEALATQLAGLGALDVYVLPDQAGHQLIAAREHAFWASKAAGADDIVDVVVPRASIPVYLAGVGDLAAATGSLVVGCGHAGDGNVHLSVFQPDPDVRHRLVHDMLAAGVALGGAVSGEHGIGTAKLATFSDLEDPVKLDLMRRIKAAFDPAGVLNPDTVFSLLALRDPIARSPPVNGAHALIRTLVGHGVDTCFMNPGTSEMHFVAALDDVPADAGGAGPLRRRGHRRGRRLRAHRRAPGCHAAPSRPRAGQRSGQPPQRPTGPQPDPQHRRRPRHHPPALRRPAAVRHRDGGPQRVVVRPDHRGHRPDSPATPGTRWSPPTVRRARWPP